MKMVMNYRKLNQIYIVFYFQKKMTPALEITVVLITLSFPIIIGQMPKKGTKGTGHTGQVLPAILSGDQSLPANRALPIDAIPTDLMNRGVNQMQGNVVPVVANNMHFVGGSVPMNANTAPVRSMAGQSEHPANNAAAQVQSSNVHTLNRSPEVQQLPNAAINDMNYRPGAMPFTQPMNMYYQQWTAPISVNMVLRNIQLACSTLQNFVLGTPLAREITASVSNMNMAEIFNSPKQCGFPALSTTLRVFLKTCNIYSSCSNPGSGPSPVPAQPVSPDVPYKVQQQTMSTGHPQVVVPQARPVIRPPLTPPPFLRQQYQAFQTQVMMMFNWLHNNFRFPQQQTKSAKGQQKQTNNSTTATVPFDD